MPKALLLLCLGICLSAKIGLAVAGDLDVYFAPYDQVTPATGYGDCNATSLEFDLCLLERVTAAAKAAGEPCKAIDHSCPYQVRFAVYNLLDMAYINPLIQVWHKTLHPQLTHSPLPRCRRQRPGLVCRSSWITETYFSRTSTHTNSSKQLGLT